MPFDLKDWIQPKVTKELISDIDLNLRKLAKRIDGKTVHDVNEKIKKQDQTSESSELKDFLNDKVDFLKIDIEGGEQQLFENNFEWLHRVRALSIELHDFIIPTSSNSFFKAMVQFAPYSFYIKGENIIIVFEN